MSPLGGVGAWSAYWTVTENGHSSKVKAGENAGAGHPRQVNLVVFDPHSGRPLQALGLGC